MKASVATKPTTDAYGGISIASILPVPLSQVRVVNPAAETDPNTAGILPSNPRVIPFPSYGNRINAGQVYASVLGGTTLVGRFWFYDTASAKWLTFGGLSTLNVVGTAGTVSGSLSPRGKSLYFQVSSVVGAVTDLSYGWST